MLNYKQYHWSSVSLPVATDYAIFWVEECISKVSRVCKTLKRYGYDNDYYYEYDKDYDFD